MEDTKKNRWEVIILKLMASPNLLRKFVNAQTIGKIHGQFCIIRIKGGKICRQPSKK